MGAWPVAALRVVRLLERLAPRQEIGAHDAWEPEPCLFGSTGEMEEMAGWADRTVLPEEGGVPRGDM